MVPGGIVKHVHFGVGDFGLGFVGWLSKQLGLELHLANRGHGADQSLSPQNAKIAIDRLYELRFVDDASREAIDVAALHNFSQPEGRSALIDLVSDPSTLLITTSLKSKDALPGIGPIISEGLLNRHARNGGYVTLLACENGFSNDDLRAAVIRGHGAANVALMTTVARFIPCVVDRVCRNTEVGSSVCVPVERFARLYLPRTVDPQIFVERLTPAARAGKVVVLEDDIKLALKKKLWLFNGPHLLLAMLAIDRGQPSFPQFVRDNLDLARNLLLECSIGILKSVSETKTPTADLMRQLDADVEELCEVNLRRFSEVPDASELIASRFRRPSGERPDMLFDFFQNLGLKVLDPSFAYCRSEMAQPRHISRALASTFDMLARDQLPNSR